MSAFGVVVDGNFLLIVCFFVEEVVDKDVWMESFFEVLV